MIVVVVVACTPSSVWADPSATAVPQNGPREVDPARAQQLEKAAAQAAEQRLQEATSTELAERTAAIRNGTASSNTPFATSQPNQGFNDQVSSAVRDARAGRLWDTIGLRELTFAVGALWLVMEARRRLRRRTVRSSASRRAV